MSIFCREQRLVHRRRNLTRLVGVETLRRLLVADLSLFTVVPLFTSDPARIPAFESTPESTHSWLGWPDCDLSLRVFQASPVPQNSTAFPLDSYAAVSPLPLSAFGIAGLAAFEDSISAEQPYDVSQHRDSPSGRSKGWKIFSIHP